MCGSSRRLPTICPTDAPTPLLALLPGFDGTGRLFEPLRDAIGGELDTLALI